VIAQQDRRKRSVGQHNQSICFHQGEPTVSSNNLFRLGGAAAIVSAILYVVSLGVQFAGSTGNLGQALYVASSFLFLAVLVILYLELRSATGLLALAGLILLGATTIWSLFVDPAQMSPLMGVLVVIYGAGFILFGWAQRSSSRYPGAVGLLALITGALAIIAGVALIAGASFDIFGVFNLALSVPFVVWLVWLGLIWFRSRTALAQPA
jgi:hypothetical protein